MLNWVALDRIFHALADPTRRYMVECLCDGEASVSWLAEHLPLGLPTILRLLDQWVTPRRRVWDPRLQLRR